MLVSTIVGFNFAHASALIKNTPVKQNINTSQQISLETHHPQKSKSSPAKQNSSTLSIVA